MGARLTVGRVIKFQFSPAILVVSDQQDGLADDGLDCILVFLRQPVQESWRNAREHHHFPGSWFTFANAHTRETAVCDAVNDTNEDLSWVVASGQRIIAT